MDKKRWKVYVNVNGKYEVKWGEWFIIRYGCDGDNSIWKFFQVFGFDFASAYFLFVADHLFMKQIGLLERHHSLIVICPSS